MASFPNTDRGFKPLDYLVGTEPEGYLGCLAWLLRVGEEKWFWSHDGKAIQHHDLMDEARARHDSRVLIRREGIVLVAGREGTKTIFLDEFEPIDLSSLPQALKDQLFPRGWIAPDLLKELGLA